MTKKKRSNNAGSTCKLSTMRTGGCSGQSLLCTTLPQPLSGQVSSVMEGGPPCDLRGSRPNPSSRSLPPSLTCKGTDCPRRPLQHYPFPSCSLAQIYGVYWPMVYEKSVTFLFWSYMSDNYICIGFNTPAVGCLCCPYLVFRHEIHIDIPIDSAGPELPYNEDVS